VLHLAGFKVELLSPFSITSMPDPEVMHEVGHMAVARSFNRDLYVYSMPLASPESMVGPPHHRLDTLLVNPRPLVFYTMFERTAIEPEIIERFNKLDGVWVPCKRNYDVLVAAGCTTAKWIPYPYFADDPHLDLSLPTGKPAMLWIGRWEPRKAPDQLIRAFLRAFRPGEATLTLKLGPAPWQHSPYPSPEDVLKEELASVAIRSRGWSDSNVGDVRIVRGRLPADAIVDLHRQSNIYVSASRGEGLDLPAFSAKLAGRLVVTTDSGGPVDFLDPDDVLVSARGTLPAAGYEKLWGEGARFIDYALDELAAGMQHAAGRLSKRTTRRQREAPHAIKVAKQLGEWLGGML
jgi:glycosyltransferase involved in cell wall biosynthesis